MDEVGMRPALVSMDLRIGDDIVEVEMRTSSLPTSRLRTYCCAAEADEPTAVEDATDVAARGRAPKVLIVAG